MAPASIAIATAQVAPTPIDRWLRTDGSVFEGFDSCGSDSDGYGSDGFGPVVSALMTTNIFWALTAPNALALRILTPMDLAPNGPG
jgi:hypothetical protein